MRTFDLGDVLSITTEILVSPRHIGGVYDILGYMTGESLFTHQLPRAADACRPELLRQHPQLASVVVPEQCDDWMAWLDDQKLVYGFELPVEPLGQFAHQNPVEELCDMIGPEKVYVILAPEPAP
jgi:hypothetical protein